jgi:transcriptional regulator with XRE-family HTH domain
VPAAAKSQEHLALGLALRQLREEAGMTQETLSLETGLHRNYVGACERGEVNIAFTNLNKLAVGLQVHLSPLVDRYESVLAAHAQR